MANILLINPSWRPTCKDILSFFNLLFFSVLSLATIAAQTKKSGHRASILDISSKNFIPVIVFSSVKKNAYNIVGVTITILLFPQVIQLLRKFMKNNLMVDKVED